VESRGEERRGEVRRGEEIDGLLGVLKFVWSKCEEKALWKMCQNVSVKKFSPLNQSQQEQIMTGAAFCQRPIKKGI